MSSWWEELEAHLEDEERVTEELRNAVFSRDGWACLHCNEEDIFKLTVHHVIYRSQGGRHSTANLVTLCGLCHAKIHKGLLNIINIRGHWFCTVDLPKLTRLEFDQTLDYTRLRRHYRWDLDRWRSAYECASLCYRRGEV